MQIVFILLPQLPLRNALFSSSPPNNNLHGVFPSVSMILPALLISEAKNTLFLLHQLPIPQSLLLQPQAAPSQSPQLHWPPLLLNKMPPKPNLHPRSPKGLHPSVPNTLVLQPLVCALYNPSQCPPPSPNLGKATPSPRLGTSIPQSQGELSAAPATSHTTSGAILIPDSNSEDEKGKGKYSIGNVIVIGDLDNDSALPQKPYLSHPAPLSSMPATPFKGTCHFKPLFIDGYSLANFFNADGNPDNVTVSPNAPNTTLQAHQLKKIKKYLKMPSTPLQARSAARQAARVLKSYVNNNAASTSVLPQDDNDEINYGIPDFDAPACRSLMQYWIAFWMVCSLLFWLLVHISPLSTAPVIL